MGTPKKTKYASWGITGAVITFASATGIGTSISGTCTDFNVNCNLQGQDEPNEYGTTIGRVVTDEIMEGTATILVPKTAALPTDAKTPITATIGGKVFLVSSVTDVQSNQQFRKIQIKLFRARNITTAAQQWDCESQT